MKNIVLCGFMGSGKTTLGRNLATALNYEFADMDSIIEEKEGKSISEIFEKEGEKYFRQLESVTAGLLAEKLPEKGKSGIVISTGGGFMTCDKNAAVFPKDRFEIIFVDRDFEEIYREIKGDRTRPLAFEKSKEELKRLYDERRPFYEKYSTRIIK